jgi:hypothetical protein
LKGFRLRMKVTHFWLAGSAVTVGWAALRRFNLVGGE